MGKELVLSLSSWWIMLRMSVYRGIYKSLSRRPESTAFNSFPAVSRESLHTSATFRSAEQEISGGREFDPAVLQFLVCPLSRKTLRYDESTSALINDELGIAYPIVDGIPNMIPQDARMIHKAQKPKETENTSE
ncbi:protein preY, mitochondrial [Mixophyes fleayi]|uniref:protein preY, mitochondrial n=1 Tax=Mixophyes fleayi TaxID=3061075 RepID=UPI003F4DEC72